MQKKEPGAFTTGLIQTQVKTLGSGTQPLIRLAYGFYLAGVAEALGRDADRLSNAYELIDQSPLGAGAFAGTSYAIDRSETAKLLGFPTVIDSSRESVALRDFPNEDAASKLLYLVLNRSEKEADA